MSDKLLLQEQLKHTVETYVKYIDVDTRNTVRISRHKIQKIHSLKKKIQICFQDKQINGEVDTLLRKLEEFEELLALSQSDGNVCLFKHVPGLQNKFAEMQNVFDKIDRY